MARDKTRDLRKGTRRNFLRKLSAMGISGATLQYMTKDALAEVTDDPKDEIPYVAYLRGEPPEREPVYKTVERDKWERRHTAMDAAEKIKNSIDNLLNKKARDKLIDVYWEESIDSPTGYAVKIIYNRINETNGLREPTITVEKLENNLPDTVSGRAGKDSYKVIREDIPVILRDKTVSNDALSSIGCMPIEYWDYTVGGVPVNIYSNSGSRIGTICAPYSSPNSGSGFITSGHVADNAGGVGATASQDVTDIGTVEHVYNGDPIDYSFVSRSKLDPAIADEDNIAPLNTITGIVTDDELINGDPTLVTQGEDTCRQEGSVRSILSGEGNVRTTHSVGGGDSGGPLFEVVNGDAHVAGVIRESYYFPDDTGSVTAQTVENHYGGWWITSNL